MWRLLTHSKTADCIGASVLAICVGHCVCSPTPAVLRAHCKSHSTGVVIASCASITLLLCRTVVRLRLATKSAAGKKDAHCTIAWATSPVRVSHTKSHGWHAYTRAIRAHAHAHAHAHVFPQPTAKHCVTYARQGSILFDEARFVSCYIATPHHATPCHVNRRPRCP